MSAVAPRANRLPGWLIWTATGRARAAVVLAAAAVAGFKLRVAFTTWGTNDTSYWREFAQGVRRWGPIGIYGHPFSEVPYNHPPLAGWLLVVINWADDVQQRFAFPFLLRGPAVLADVVTALLIFELVRSYRSRREATAAALLVAASPVLFIVSGFHGNTDPIFCMFVLLSVYLLAVRGQPGLAGLSFAIALSIKLIPIVTLPVLLLYAARLGRRQLLSFLVGSGSFLLLVWGPVLVSRWTPFRTQVLGYRGIGLREWGPVQFADWAGLPGGFIDFLIGPGRFGIVLAAAGLPLLLLWRHPDRLAPAIGLSLCLLLLLSTGYGIQYLAWPLAGAYLISFWAATAYNLVAGIFMLIVYSDWNNAAPGHWKIAFAYPLHGSEIGWALAAWTALLVVTVLGLRQLRVADRPPDLSRPDSELTGQVARAEG